MSIMAVSEQKSVPFVIQMALNVLVFSFWKILFFPVEKLFVTAANIRKQLSGLSADGSTEPCIHPELEVTEIDKEKMVVTIKEPGSGRRKKRMSESADEIEVVHSHHNTELRSIIKSRTVSESSDDLSSYARQNSTTSFNGSETSPLESDDNSEGSGGRKKSVSFCEHVDKTTYKTNQSVISMKATLKNKRRSQRKRERKHSEKEQRRRRKSSGSEGVSSDDMTSPTEDIPSPLGAEHVVVDVSTLDAPDSSGYDAEIDDSSPTVDKPAKSKVFPDRHEDDRTISTEEGDGEPNVDSGVIAGDGSNGKSGDLNNVQDGSSSDIMDVRTVVNDKSDGAEEEELDSDDGEDLKSVHPPKAGLIQELDPHNERNREGVVEDVESANQSTADTVLSWNDGRSSVHSTKCAFSFANNVIYDLDVE